MLPRAAARLKLQLLALLAGEEHTSLKAGRKAACGPQGAQPLTCKPHTPLHAGLLAAAAQSTIKGEPRVAGRLWGVVTRVHGPCPGVRWPLVGFGAPHACAAPAQQR